MAQCQLFVCNGTEEIFSFQMSHQLLFLQISIDDLALVGNEEAEWGKSLGR